LEISFKKLAQNGHAEAACIAGFLIRAAARPCALCASEQHAQDGPGVMLAA
jgi:hypothetical protein